MLFFVGLDRPSDAAHFPRCMVSWISLRKRKSDFAVNEWLLDSGAFTQVTKHGRFIDSPETYAAGIVRWSRCGKLLAAVSQDFMCEPLALGATGLSVAEHQRLTIERYIRIHDAVGNAAYVMPVLQGYWPGEYLSHLRQYGDLLAPGQWVGVGSICKRNSNIQAIEDVLWPIKQARPDLRLHGFGIKITALESTLVRECLHSADSMAWSYGARRAGRDAHDRNEAHAFCLRIATQRHRRKPYQQKLFA